MVKPAYTPERGDLVWLTFTPQSGAGQVGRRRTALVLSPAAYNDKVGLALFCPITSQVKGYPFEVAVPAGLPISGVVLADQAKSLDWRAHNAEWAGKLPASALEEVVQKLLVLLDMQPEARK